MWIFFNLNYFLICINCCYHFTKYYSKTIKLLKNFMQIYFYYHFIGYFIIVLIKNFYDITINFAIDFESLFLNFH